MKLLQKIKKQGYRLTQPRQKIIQVLEKYPLTVQEIYQELKKKHIQVDLASVYRSLELFTTMGIVQPIELGEGKKRYELIDKNHHHHHVVCNNCGDIDDIQFDERRILEEITRKSKFQIKQHNVEFFGLCTNCQ